jgi:hypothetical protein
MSAIDKWVAGLGAATSIAAAFFWFWASVIPVPDNLDTFIGVLRRISRINAFAAGCAAMAALCAAYSFAKMIWG